VGNGPSPDSPAQTLRSALQSYLTWVHNCREGASCWDDCSELVIDAANEWMTVIDRWGASGPHMVSGE
jgi:hypothetical protein